MRIEILNAPENIERRTEIAEQNAFLRHVMWGATWLVLSLVLTIYVYSKKPNYVFVSKTTCEKVHKKRH
jgi:hypothetical protein